MPRKLKVFRTPIGFHDAYVAVPSRKAALAAWGSDADLFARGVAEEVTDPKLAKEPLAHPGEVIKLSRGDLPAHLKALPKRKRAKAREAEPAAKPRKPKPPPKRDKLDAAEAAVKELQARHAKEAQALERQLETLRARQGKELAKVMRRRDAARAAYRDALEQWSG